MTLLLHTFPSALGPLRLATWEGRLASLDYEEFEPRFRTLLAKRFPDTPGRRAETPSDIALALEGFFAGATDSFRDIALEERGAAFETRVWAGLRAVRFGATASYAEIARAIGAGGAARAVGRANALNPIAIVIPCHRVIAASGALTGYAGALWRKEWLLAHERTHAA